jgi:hypothetical protein
MANIKITDLTAYTSPADTDVLPIVDVGADVTKKVSVGEIVGTVSGDVNVATDGTSSIAAGAIVNADVNASAAIAGTKISPDFGSQAVTTTGLISANGRVSFPLGSAAAPSLYPGSDTNTGIYSPGADQVAVSTGGTGRLFVDSTGVITTETGFTSSRFNIVNPNSVSTYDRLLAIRNGSLSTAFLGVGLDSFYVASGSGSPMVFCTSSDGGVSGTSVPTNERLRIDSSGRLLVGTSTTDSSFNSGIQIAGIGGSNAGSQLISRFSADAASPTLWFQKSRGASVGTNTIVNNGDDLGLIGFYGASGSTVNEAARVTAQVDGTPGASNDMPGRLVFYTTAAAASSPTERMRITSAGNVGIGTTSVGFGAIDHGVHIYGSGAQEGIRLETTNGSGGILEIYAENGGNTLDTRGSGYIRFNNVATEWGRWDSSGRLLVGTSTARGNFFNHIISSAFNVEVSTDNSIEFAGIRNRNDINGGAILLAKSRGTTAGSNTIIQSGDELGRVSFQGSDGSEFVEGALIQAQVDGTPGSNDMPGRLVFSTTASGASSPTARLTIASNGDFRVANTGFFHPVTDNAVSLGLSGFRWSAVWAANGTIQTSDERAKADITNATLGSDFIKALRPVSYRWIEGGKRDTGERDEDNNYIYESVSGTRTHWGFIAQEVKQAVDDAGVDFGGWVLTDKDDPDSQQALRYDQFIAPLTKALQEALEKIETLEAKVAALESA